MMKNQRNTILILLAIILCLCVVIVGSGLMIWQIVGPRLAQTTEPVATQVTQDTPVTPGLSVDETQEATPAPQSTITLSDDVLREMEEIEAEVVELRGIDPAFDFQREILTKEGISERVKSEFFADYTSEEAADDARILGLLGLLDPTFDLVALYTDLYSDQILGYFDSETGQMVVVGNGEFAGPEKSTYAHEYAHALQDANFNTNGEIDLNEEVCEADSERCGAIRALVEGEALFIELQWFVDYATTRERLEIMESYAQADDGSFESFPSYLQQDLLFDYVQGYAFVEQIYKANGWQGLNDAYANLPVSTEQILHPEKYPSDKPLDVTLPDLNTTLGEGWELLDDNVMGEWYLYMILAHGMQPEHRLQEDAASGAAAGWGGDRYVILINRETGGLVLAMKTIWDTTADLSEFSDAFRRYASARFGNAGGIDADLPLWETNEGVHIFFESADAAYWVFAPSPELANQVLSAIR